MTVAVLRYNAGNIQSIAYTLDRLGCEYVLTSNAQEIMRADKVIFPGVGEARTTMNFLREHGLNNLIPSLSQPVLGICLGMQLLCRNSEENDTDCLKVFDLPVKRFLPTDEFKVPHMGWNKLTDISGWLPASTAGDHVYFAHTYYVPVNEFMVAKADHTIPFSAALQKQNFYAVQFHPEKSGDVGSAILNTFLDL